MTRDLTREEKITTALNVWRIRSLMGNAYVVKGDRVALVDTLSRGDLRMLMRGLRKAGVDPEDVDFILLTHHHVDHAANAAALKKLSGATLVAGAADAPVVEGAEPTGPCSDLSPVGRLLSRIPGVVHRCQRYPRTKVDRPVVEGEVIEELGLEVVSLPGHTAGGVGYLHRESDTAFIGDMVTNGFGVLQMPSLAFSQSLEAVFGSQERLAGLGLEVAYPGHGPRISPEASRRIREFRDKKYNEFMTRPRR